ncbi:MAG: class I SAM-dependent methyltransferase [Acidimicrobiia bacterium]|nr:class I SAM-dependent methyltransferase [Acidimicrobiia bacterium]
MSSTDREHWDRRYSEAGEAPPGDHGPPPAFAPIVHLFPHAGTALDVACGRGRGTVWLARRGLTVHGIDVSPVAIELARELAQADGLEDRCSFEVVDLDGGLPPGPAVDVLMCHLFNDPLLHDAMRARVKPGGILAVATLSEVGAGPGPFRARPGELAEAFSDMDLLHHAEGDGVACIVARRR